MHERAPGGKALLRTQGKGALDVGLEPKSPALCTTFPGGHTTLWALTIRQGMSCRVMLESRMHVLRFIVRLGGGGGKWPRSGCRLWCWEWCREDEGAGAWKENKGKEGVSGMSGETWAALSIF